MHIDRRFVGVGTRRPFSQLMAVTFDRLKSPANPAWLTLSFWHNAVTSAGPTGLIGTGRESWRVRKVNSRLPCTRAVNACTLCTRASASDSISFRFVLGILVKDRTMPKATLGRDSSMILWGHDSVVFGSGFVAW